MSGNCRRRQFPINDREEVWYDNSLCVGLIVSIFQTVTSIQEQTLTFVPKIVCVFLSLVIFGNWMMNAMVEFMVSLWSNFGLYMHQ